MLHNQSIIYFLLFFVYRIISFYILLLTFSCILKRKKNGKERKRRKRREKKWLSCYKIKKLRPCLFEFPRSFCSGGIKRIKKLFVTPFKQIPDLYFFVLSTVIAFHVFGTKKNKYEHKKTNSSVANVFISFKE